MFSSEVRTLVATVTLIFGLCDQSFAKTTPAKPPPDYTAVAAATFLADPEAHKMVYMATIRHAANMEIAAGHYSPADAEALRKSMMENALISINGDKWSSTSVAALKDAAAVGAGVAGGQLGVPIPTNLLNLGIDAILKTYETDGKIPVQDPAVFQTVTAWMLHAAKDSNNPDHAWAAEQVRNYLKLDPALDYAFLPGVQDRIQMQEVKDLIVDLQAKIKALKEGGGSEDDAEELDREQARAQALMTNMYRQFVAAHQEILNRGKSLSQIEKEKKLARAKELKQNFDEISKGFGNLSGIAVLFKKPDLAKFFHNAQLMTDAFGKVVEVSLTTTFSEQPMAYTNVYVAAALIVVNMINESQQETAEQQMHDLLVSIAQELDQMRKEMHARFDTLEFQANDNFRVALFDLKNLSESANKLQVLAYDLIDRADKIENETKTGLKFDIKTKLTDWQTRCLFINPQGKKAHMDAELLPRCRNQFAELATSNWETPLRNPLENADTYQQYAKMSDDEYIALKESVAKLDSTQAFGKAKVHPFNYVYGAQMFIDLFNHYPRFNSYAPDSGINRSDLSLTNLIDIGKQTSDSLTHLSLTKQREGYTLKKELFEAVLQKYRAESLEAVRAGENMAQHLSYAGPRPSKGADEPIYIGGDYEFLNSGIGVCDPKDAVLNGPTPSKAFTIANWYNTWNPNPNSRFLDSMIAFGLPTIPPYQWNQSFLPLIPAHAVWASRMKNYAQNLKLTACFRRFHFTNLILGEGGVHFTLHIDLEFWGSTDQTRQLAQAQQQFLVGKSAMEWDYAAGGNFRGISAIVPNLWYGQSCANGCNFNWPGIVKDATAPGNFAPVEIPIAQQDPQFVAYKAQLDQNWKDNTSSGLQAIDKMYDTRPGINAKRELYLLANLGLDPSVPEAKVFMDWLAYPDSLPSQTELAKFAFSSDMPDTAIAAVIDAKVELARQQIETLANAKTLRPRDNELAPILAKLIALNGGKSATVGGSKSTIRQMYDSFMSNF